MKKQYDAVAVIGQSKTTGKKYYQNCGIAFVESVGGELRISFKPSAIPVAKDWNGYINFYERKPKGSENGNSDGNYVEMTSHTNEFNDEIPF